MLPWRSHLELFILYRALTLFRSSLLVSQYVFHWVGMCTQVRTRVLVCGSMCGGQKPSVGIFSHSPAYPFEAGPLTEPGTCSPLWPAMPQVNMSPCLAFNMCAGEPKLALAFPTCGASSLPTEPSSQTLQSIFKQSSDKNISHLLLLYFLSPL